MCGIVGRFNHLTGAPVDPSVVQGMADLIAHRGPDGDGVWTSGPVGFGHRRLAIIDLSPGGAQLILHDPAPNQAAGNLNERVADGRAARRASKRRVPKVVPASSASGRGGCRREH